MCTGRIARDALPDAVLAGAMARLEGLMEDGLVVEEAGAFIATDEGLRFLRHFAACFDAYLAPSPRRHSAAV